MSDIARILKTNVESLINGVHKETNLKKNINFAPNRFAKYLSKLRKANNLTQKNLSDIINVLVQSISKYENGGFLPSLEVLCKFWCTN